MQHSVYPAHASPTAWLWMSGLLNLLGWTALIAFTATWPSTTSGRLFFFGYALTHAALVATLILAPAAACTHWRVLRPARLPLAVASMTLAWAVLLVDTRLYTLYGFHLNGLVLSLLVDGYLLDQLGLSTLAVQLAVAALLSLAGVQSVLAWAIRTRMKHLHRASRHLGLALLACIPCMQLAAILLDATGRHDTLGMLESLPGARPITARGALTRLGFDIQPRPALAYAPSAPTPDDDILCTMPAPLNVLVIAVDSLRADMLAVPTMPMTSHFAGTAWQAMRHLSTGNNTMHGLFGLLHGVSGAHAEAYMRAGRGSVLIEQLERQGASFHIVGAAPLEGTRLDRTAFAGLDAPLLTPSDQTPVAERDHSASAMLRASLDRRDSSRPFFGFLLLDGAHSPYAVPDGAATPFLPQAEPGAHLFVQRRTDPMPLFNRYRNAVFNVDRVIGELLAWLTERGLDSSTVVVVTSDHGEAFNESGDNRWGHNSRFDTTQVQVPMLIRWPGRPPGHTTAITSHLDLVPTLLRDLLGCTLAPFRLPGHTLFDAHAQDRTLLIQGWEARAIHTGGRYLPLGRSGLSADMTLDETASRQLIEQLRDQTPRIRPGTVAKPPEGGGAGDAALD